MNLNELRDEAYRIAVAHGWHDERRSDQHYIMLVISELAEAVEADRKNRHAKSDYYKKRVANSIICKGLDPEIPKEEGYQAAFEEAIKDTVEDELADVVIRILDLSGLYGIDFKKMPDAFVKNDNDVDKELMDEIRSESMTEFTYSCTCQAIRICEYGISWGFIECLLHRIYLYSVIKGFDLEWHVRQKMRYNEHRPYKYGKRY